jgi:hypothetical protein
MNLMKPRRIWVNEFKSGMSDIWHYESPEKAIAQARRDGEIGESYVRTVQFIEVLPKKEAKVKK